MLYFIDFSTCLRQNWGDSLIHSLRTDSHSHSLTLIFSLSLSLSLTHTHTHRYSLVDSQQKYMHKGITCISSKVKTMLKEYAIRYQSSKSKVDQNPWYSYTILIRKHVNVGTDISITFSFVGLSAKPLKN